MKSVGIIAEYNPIHLGHTWHIRESLRLTDAECVIAVMSGDFVQRGAPAVLDKFDRASMAVLSGADLVVELPVSHATASAERFALGGVGLLHALGVDFISFGMENDDLKSAGDIADVLCDEPCEYSDNLRIYLRNGLTMASAREKSLEAMGIDCGILKNPNNILAIEYLKAMKKINAAYKPVAVKRMGNDYNGTDKNLLPSATLVRQVIHDESLEQAMQYLPEECRTYRPCSAPLFENDFSKLLNYSILMNIDSLSDYEGVNDAFADKLRKCYTQKDFYNFSELAMALKSKDTTYTGICRGLNHILLGIKKDIADVSYIRVLAMNDRGRRFLKDNKEKISLPVITTLSKASIDPNLATDIRSSIIYNQALLDKYGIELSNDYRRNIIIT